MKLEDLRKIRERAGKDLNLRTGKARARIIVSMGTSGIAAGAREVLAAFLDAIEKFNVTDVVVTQSGDKGYDSFEPVAEVRIEGKPTIIYGKLTPEAARRIVKEHLIEGKPVAEYIVEVKEEEEGVQ